MSMMTRLGSAAGLATLAALSLLPRTAVAQRSGDGFLFTRPGGAFTVRMGYAQPNASGDPYTFLRDQLTLSKGSFGAVSLAGDVSFRATPRLDVVASLGWSGSQAPSEMRHWTGPPPDNAPIQQTTSLQRLPITASLKYYLVPAGRSVGRFAWVPSRYAPYVGVGGGVMYYHLKEWGNYVDYQDSTIYYGEYNASDWTGTAHLFTGVDVALGPRFVVSGEARYTWAKAALSNDFSGFSRIDLSGFALTAGIGVRF